MNKFKFNIEIKATTEEVFNALTNPYQIAIWTGYPAIMSTEEGSEFSLWDGDICGKNMTIVPNKEITQEWYFGDQEKKSIANIKLKQKTANITKVELYHTNIPSEDFEDICEGWKEYSLGAVKTYLELY